MGSLKPILRRLLRTPGFTAIAVATLAVGIGANTAVFSVLNGVLLKPLPYPESDRLVSMSHAAPGMNLADVGSAPYLYFTEREQNRTLEAVGLWGSGAASVTGTGEPERVQTLLVTFEILPMLRVPPLYGRYFTQRDDSPGSPQTVILTYGYWQRHFGGDPRAVGQTLDVNGEAREIIGVMPRSFGFLDQPADLIQPYRLDRGQVQVNDGYYWRSIARLKPGVTLEQASDDVARLIPIAIDAFPLRPGATREQVESAHFGPHLRPLKEEVVGDIGDTLWVLMGTIGLVLLIACANVANLQLIRAEGRQQEISIRAALGAGAGRIARELVLESVVLGLVGGALGLGLAYGGLALLLALAPANVPRLGEIGIDTSVLAFASAASLLAGVLFGSIPAANYARARLAAGLHAGGRALGGGRERHRARGALVAAQVALALVLLISAGLMIRTFQALTDVDPGFAQPADVITFGIDVPSATVQAPEGVARLQQAILDRVAAVPGVTSAAFGSSPPMGRGDMGDVLTVPGRTVVKGDQVLLGRFKFVSPGFFETAGTPLIAGRALTWSDTYETHPVALVSENLARLVWGSAAGALGQRVRGSSGLDEWRDIVGVVGDVRDNGITQPATEAVYVPLLVERFLNTPIVARRSATFLVRSPRTGQPGFLDEIRAAVWSVNPDLPLANVRTLGDIYQRSLARTSLTLVLLAIAAAMALLLGVVGIYGVIAYAVSQSTREIGLRIALGAQPRAVKQVFVRRALVLAALGIVLGLGAAVGVSRLLASLLYGVSTLDPLTYVIVCALLLAAVAVASYLPARRAARIDPLEALRAE
jgi:predicted permease